MSGLLIFFIAMVCAGVSKMASSAFWILPSLYILYLIACRIKAGKSGRTSSFSNLYYLQGYASMDTVCIDTGVAVSTFPWLNLKFVAYHNDFVALPTRDQRQYVIASEDIFETPEQWAQCRKLVHEKSGSASKSLTL